MTKTRILGITAPISENTAACLLEDGKIIAFAEEERFTRIKHAHRLIPRKSIEYCLRKAGISLMEVDHIAVGYESVARSWAKNIWANLTEGNFPRIIRENGAYLEYFLKIFRLKDFFASLDRSGKNSSAGKASWDKIIFVPHHVAHAASSAQFSGFEKSLVISLDGVGENNAGILGYFKNNEIIIEQQIPINQSLGWFYAKITEICGFVPHSQEGKTMGLAAYGQPKSDLLKNIARLTKNGYVLEKNWVAVLEKRFSKRKKSAEISQAYKDLAATAQHFLEKAACHLAADLHQKTGIRNICLAGGVALNCDMNSKIMESGFFDHIFIQPAANDAGTALGAAAQVYFQKTGKACEALMSPYGGPSYSDEAIEKILQEAKLKYRKIESLAEVAQKIYEGKIVGWFSGKMEFGPRALGGRSILANPQLADMKEKINRQVKHRENWRPFAPSILKEHAPVFFEKYHPSPLMLLTFKTRPEKMKDIQAALHVDGTARVQEVSRQTNPRYYELIEEFRKISGVPALLNTSFNDRGEPIVLSPQDALRTFFSTGLDALVIEDFILEK